MNQDVLGQFNFFILEILKDHFESIFIDWRLNEFDSEKKNLKTRGDLNFSEGLIFHNSSRSTDLLNNLLKSFGSKKIQNALFFEENQEYDDSCKSFKRGDWPFPLSGFNLIGLYFFLDRNIDHFDQEIEIYKFFTLCFYSLKEKGLIFSLSFGQDNLQDFFFDIKDFFNSAEFQKTLDFHQILHNFQKIGFKDSIFLNEKFSLNFCNFEEFFDFLSKSNLEKVLFSDDQINVINENKTELIQFLNSKRQEEISKKGFFEMSFGIIFLIGWS